MAQRIVDDEQYEVLLIKGGEDGSPLPVAVVSGVIQLPSGTTVNIGAEVEISNDEGNPVPVDVERLQGEKAFAVAPNDNADLTFITSALYVGFTGNISMILSGDTNAVTFFNVPGGSILPLRVKRVRSTSTTASGIVGLL